ncbi:branched-chain amino acid ABC transporter substrate-binding protein [Niveibacterium sp. SC-1]|uniref:branched-chain amino acid ABC transporter substrate-binding protein n=1 Tax=Niveibacterium sp. SC-1 TaxID=3135646 RepID=UPI00311FBCDD
MKKSAILVALIAALAGCSKEDSVVKIGHVAPLTGNIAHLGKDNENGARLAIDDANAEGVSIGGHKVTFELVGEDDQADPKTGNIVAQRLVDAGVKGVVGHLNSGTTIPASRIYDAAGIPMISPSATNPKLTQAGLKGVFRTIANDVQQGSVMGSYAAGKLGKKVAIIDDRTAYGQGLADEVEKGVKGAGGEVVAREFTSNQATDFMAILTKIKATNPEVIVYAGMDAQGGPMLKQIKQLGIEAKWITGDGGCTPEIIKLAGDSISDKTYCTQPGLPPDQMQGGKDFKERFKAKFGTEVQIYAPYSYDAVKAIIEAMKKADSTDPAKYLPELKKITFKGVTADVAFDDKGDIKNGAVTVYQYDNGNWKALAN